MVSIASEKVTEMLTLIETPLWLSVGEVDETVGAVVSVVVVLSVVVAALSSLLVQEETSNAMLTIRTNRDNKIFTFYLFLILKEVGLKSHKFKIFNPIDRLKKTKY